MQVGHSGVVPLDWSCARPAPPRGWGLGTRLVLSTANRLAGHQPGTRAGGTRLAGHETRVVWYVCQVTELRRANDKPCISLKV